MISDEKKYTQRSLFVKIFLCTFCILFGILLFKPLTHLSFSNQNWLPKEHPIEKNKRYLDEEFNQGERLVLLVQIEDGFFKPKHFKNVIALQKKLAKIEYVKRIQSPTNAKSIFKDNEGTLHNITYADAIKENVLPWGNYLTHLKSSPYWRRLISSDTKTIALVMTLSVSFSENNTNLRKQVYREMKEILKLSPFKQYTVSGETELLYRLDFLSEEDLKTLLPISIMVLCLLLFAFYRKLSFPLIIASVVFINLLVTLNLMKLSDLPFNVLSANLPLLVLIIAMADSVHISRRWQANQHIVNPMERCILCWQETWLPCLITSITSAIGFGVFTFSEILPLKHFGELSFISILIAYPIIMGLNLLFLYTFLPEGKTLKPYNLPIQSIVRQKKLILGVTSIALIITLSLLHRGTTESNFLDVFFSPKSQTAKGFNVADTQLSGSGNIDIILQSSQTDTFKRLDNFENIKKQVESLKNIPLINSIESLLEAISMVHKPLSDQQEVFPTNEGALAQEILFLEFSRSDKESDILSSNVDFLYQNSRIHLYTPNLSSKKISQVIENVMLSLEQSPYRIIVTGMNVYFQQLSKFVLDTQLSSILLTGGIILLSFILLFGLAYGSLAALLNFIPVIIILGGQVLFRIPFDFATVLVASISLGLCIDNMAHFCHRFIYYLKAQNSSKTALQLSINDLQTPIFLTSLILVVGFSILLLSKLVVIQKFALLTALAIILSLAMFFLVLPCVFADIKSKKK
jgi:hypothetical protein